MRRRCAESGSGELEVRRHVTGDRDRARPPPTPRLGGVSDRRRIAGAGGENDDRLIDDGGGNGERPPVRLVLRRIAAGDLDDRLRGRECDRAAVRVRDVSRPYLSLYDRGCRSAITFRTSYRSMSFRLAAIASRRLLNLSPPVPR